MTPKKIIVVEDNEGDVVLIRQALESTGLDFNLRWIGDGILAAQVLGEPDASADDGVSAAQILGEPDVSADLIVLDVSLPGRNGWQLLELIGNNPIFKRTHVILLSGSDSAFDIARAQRMGRMFFKKPMQVQQYRQIAEVIIDALAG